MVNEIINKKIIFGYTKSSIREISELMKNNNIGFIPLKENNNYVGVITDRDICISLTDIKNLDDEVKSYMTNNVIYIDLNSSIDEALNKMKKYKIKRLLVKEKDSVIGILSLSDILNYTNNNNILSAYKEIFYIHDNNKEFNAEIDEFYL